MSEDDHPILQALGTDLAWVTSQAICGQVDPELFFPDPGGKNRAAKSLCLGCDLIEPCRNYALAYRPIGIWGGTSEHDRRSA